MVAEKPPHSIWKWNDTIQVLPDTHLLLRVSATCLWFEMGSFHLGTQLSPTVARAHFSTFQPALNSALACGTMQDRAGEWRRQVTHSLANHALGSLLPIRPPYWSQQSSSCACCLWTPEETCGESPLPPDTWRTALCSNHNLPRATGQSPKVRLLCGDRLDVTFRYRTGLGMIVRNEASPRRQKPFLEGELPPPALWGLGSLYSCYA